MSRKMVFAQLGLGMLVAGWFLITNSLYPIYAVGVWVLFSLGVIWCKHD